MKIKANNFFFIFQTKPFIDRHYTDKRNSCFINFLTIVFKFYVTLHPCLKIENNDEIL